MLMLRIAWFTDEGCGLRVELHFMMLESLVFLCVDGFCGKGNFKRRRRLSLKCLLFRVENCARVSVDSLYRNTNMWYVKEGCGQLWTVEPEHLSAVCLKAVGNYVSR